MSTNSGTGIPNPMSAHKRQPSRMDQLVPNDPLLNYDHDYEGTAKEIWEQMTYPTIEKDTKNIIQLYENWSKGKFQHCYGHCVVSSDPMKCICLKYFDPHKDREQVLLDFKIEITRALKTTALEIHRRNRGQSLLMPLPQFAQDKLTEFLNGVDRVHHLTDEEKEMLAKNTGLSEDQVLMWWYDWLKKQHAENQLENESKDGGPNNTAPTNPSSTQ